VKKAILQHRGGTRRQLGNYFASKLEFYRFHCRSYARTETHTYTHHTFSSYVLHKCVCVCARACVYECVANNMEEEDFLLSPESHNISRNIFSPYFTTKPATNFQRLREHCWRNREYRVALSLAMEIKAEAQITECYVCGVYTLELRDLGSHI
jgi:hypothetical protein